MQHLRRPGWLLTAGLACAVGAGCERTQAVTLPKDPTEVVVARPTVREVTDFEEFTGHTDAILSVQIKARVTGYLDKKDAVDGQEVREGDLLYEIDDRPYRATLERAEATVAQLGAHRARLQLDLRRATNLFQKAAIGKQEFDMVSGDFAESEAALHAAQAQLDSARLNMTFTKVRAPMDGHLGRILVDPGNLIRQDDTILNDIVAADKLYVYFDVGEESMRRIRGLIEQGRVRTADAKAVPVAVGTADDFDRYDDAMTRLETLKTQGRTPTAAEKAVPDEFPYRGTVDFSENKLDAATGTLRVRGIIDNPRPWILSPGLFVRVHLPIGEPHPATLVRDDAVGSDQGKTYVYVVDVDDEVIYRPVETGSLFGGLRAIKSGLGPDERIIVNADARQRVRPGSKVAPKFAPTGPATPPRPA